MTLANLARFKGGFPDAAGLGGTVNRAGGRHDSLLRRNRDKTQKPGSESGPGRAVQV